MEANKHQSLKSHRSHWAWLVGMCGLAGLVLPARGQYDPNWVRNFRVGGLAGFNIKADLKLKPGTINISGSKAGVYDDGYVHPDSQNTADDFTSNWGYENDEQYNAGTQTLTLHRTTSFAAEAGTIKHGDSDESFPIGFDMEYGGYPWRWDRMRLGFNLGFGFLPLNFTQKISAEGNIVRAADVFSTDVGTGTPPIFPPAGYHGSAGGDGWNIHGTSTPGAAENNGSGSLVGTETLDVTLFAFRVGPTLFFDLTERIGLAVGAGPAFGFISGQYEFDETITTDADNSTSRSHGHFDVSDFVFGGYINTTLTYHATLNGDFYLSAQYMPLGTAEFSKGTRSAKLDLSGAVMLSAGVNWPF